jgi:large subunit ribosomal protein L9
MHRQSYFILFAALQSLWNSAEAFVPVPLQSLVHRRSANPIVQGVRITNPFLSPPSTALPAGKKKAGGSAVSHGGKVQVKLLKHVAGMGQAGEVVLVTPAFFNNKLRPTQSARVISDDEVAKEQSEAEQHEKEAIATAKTFQEKIEGLTLTLTKKAGPDGHLFGGINIKMIVTELQASLGDEKEYMTQKHVKISDLSGEDGTKIDGDIKHTGKFAAKIHLRKDVVAKFDIVVNAEH